MRRSAKKPNSNCLFPKGGPPSRREPEIQPRQKRETLKSPRKLKNRKERERRDQTPRKKQPQGSQEEQRGTTQKGKPQATKRGRYMSRESQAIYNKATIWMNKEAAKGGTPSRQKRPKRTDNTHKAYERAVDSARQ